MFSIIKDVTDLCPVGEGTWGIVYKAKWHGPVAVKKLKCQDPNSEQVTFKDHSIGFQTYFLQIKEFQNEVRILRQLRHKNIVLFMSYILDPPKDMCIVMHWCSSSLYRRIHISKDVISVKEAIRISKETAQVFFY